MDEKEIQRSTSGASSTWWLGFLVIPMLREFSTFLTVRAYTWYGNLRPGFVSDFEQLVSLFDPKFFYAKNKFSLVELDHVRQYSGVDLDTYVRSFLYLALDCCDPRKQRMLVDVCSMEWYKNTTSSSKIYLSHTSPSWWKLLVAPKNQ